MAACPNCAHPLDASAACSACNQERPPASDALLTPGPAANNDRRRTLLALVPLLLLIASVSPELDLEWPVSWLIALGSAAMTLWYARTEPPRLRWDPNLERSARRRDRAWMVFAIALGNSVVASTILWCLVLWGPIDGLWSSGLGGLIVTYHYMSEFFGMFGIIIGLASVVWRLEVAARRRGRVPSRFLYRTAMAAFLSTAIISAAYACTLLVPSAALEEAGPTMASMDVGLITHMMILGSFLVGGAVILGMLPPALRSPRQQPSAA